MCIRDSFELVIKESRYGDGAGKDFDSSDDKYTSWYERYDEDGNRVGYDYETDTWEDGYTREEVDDRVDEDDPDSDVESETGEQTADSER